MKQIPSDLKTRYSSMGVQKGVPEKYLIIMENGFGIICVFVKNIALIKRIPRSSAAG